MPSNPKTVIEQISASDDRQLAIQFFLLFSRFEYSLKRCGYVEASKEQNVKPDWSKYAKDKQAFIDSKSFEHEKIAIGFITREPPMIQKKGGNGELSWKRDKFNSKLDLDRLLVLVRRIRNNLFHGGKFPNQPVEEISRDRELLNSASKILYACLDEDRTLRSKFMEGLLE